MPKTNHGANINISALRGESGHNQENAQKYTDATYMAGGLPMAGPPDQSDLKVRWQHLSESHPC